MPFIFYNHKIIIRITLFFLLGSAFAVHKGHAQLPVDFRTEQVFLTTDKTDYNVDDTIHIEGVLTSLSHAHSDPYSRVLYVELIDASTDSVVIRRKLMCNEKGLFKAAIIPDADAGKGDYFLRSYTNLMRNFNPDSFPLRHITIGKPTTPDDGIIDEDIHCMVAPMGRHLIPDIPQQITAVLTSSLGYPRANQTLVLVSSAGDTLELRETSPSGYAIFNFIPRRDENYKLLFSAMGVNKAFQVPETDSYAFRIAGAINGSKLRFAIEGNAPDNRRIFSFDRSNGLSEISTSSVEGVTTLAHAPTGPVTLFLTDNKLNLLSQTTLLPKVEFNSGITVADTLKANQTLDLVPAGTKLDSMKILSRFIPVSQPSIPVAEYELAASDFESPLPFPVRSFSTSEASTDFQAWLGEGTFRRFDLAEAVKSDCDVYSYMPEQIMTISGIVYDDVKAKHPMKGGRLVAYNGTNRLVTDTCVDKKGRFTVEVDFFKDGTEFFLQGINSKGVLIGGVINIDDTTYPAVGRLPKVTEGKKRNAFKSTDSIGVTGVTRILPNVVVKARAIRTEKRNDKKYYGARYLDQDHFEKYSSLTVLDALRRLAFARVLLVMDDDNEPENGTENLPYYIVQSTRLPSTLPSISAQLPIVVDGVLMDIKDCQYIFDMPTMQVESIEQLTPAEALMYTSNNLYGAILIKTKLLGPKPPKAAKGLRCWPPGLTDMPPVLQRTVSAPEKPGNYRLVVDMVSGDGKVRSVSRDVHVAP